MRDVDVKITGNQVEGSEFNSTTQDQQTLVTSTGQTLAPAIGGVNDVNQLAQATRMYALRWILNDNSTQLNEYLVDDPVGGTILKPAILFDGMGFIFVPFQANTGISTLNAFNLGTRPLRRIDGSPLQPGDVIALASVICFYHAQAGQFRIIPILAVPPPDSISTIMLQNGSVTGPKINDRTFGAGGLNKLETKMAIDISEAGMVLRYRPDGLPAFDFLFAENLNVQAFGGISGSGEFNPLESRIADRSEAAGGVYGHTPLTGDATVLFGGGGENILQSPTSNLGTTLLTTTVFEDRSIQYWDRISWMGASSEAGNKRLHASSYSYETFWEMIDENEGLAVSVANIASVRTTSIAVTGVAGSRKVNSFTIQTTEGSTLQKIILESFKT